MTARPQALVKSEGDEIKDDAEEKQLRLKIERWSGQSPVPGYFWTLGNNPLAFFQVTARRHCRKFRLRGPVTVDNCSARAWTLSYCARLRPS
jgi:hypothetical protein